VTFLLLLGWVPSARLSVIAIAGPGERHIIISRQEVLALARRHLLAEQSSNTLSLLFEHVPHLVTAMRGVRPDLSSMRGSGIILRHHADVDMLFTHVRENQRDLE
jgi:hypothetical protein